MGQPSPPLNDGEIIEHSRPRHGQPALKRVMVIRPSPPRITREISGPPRDPFPNRVTR